MIHVVQNAGIVQVLCNTPGSEDSAEFKYMALLYAVLIFFLPVLSWISVCPNLSVQGMF